MTRQEALGEPSNSQFESIAYHRDGVIFHSHILCNDSCHGLHDDDDCTCSSVGMDSSTIAAAQTERGVKSNVAKETQNQKDQIKKMYDINKLRWVHTKGNCTQRYLLPASVLKKRC